MKLEVLGSWAQLTAEQLCSFPSLTWACQLCYGWMII